MDYLRSCYSRNMRFVAGDPSQTFLAKWYFADPQAIPFPFVHRFGSANWDYARKEESDLGDQAKDTMRYSSGRILNRSNGQTYAGSLNCFVNGCDAPGAIDRGTDGTPVECLIPPFGLALGGLSPAVIPGVAGIRKGGRDNPVSFDLGGLKKSGTSL